MIIGCKLATTEYGAKTFFQSQLVKIIDTVHPYCTKLATWYHFVCAAFYTSWLYSALIWCFILAIGDLRSNLLILKLPLFCAEQLSKIVSSNDK